MGHKNVCLNCRKAFNMPFGVTGEMTCRECGQQMIRLPHRFRPPKKTETAKWETVKFLVEHGFSYQHIYHVDENPVRNDKVENYVQYPENMREAQEFVIMYRAQAKQK
ncbi:hypothetical protein [Hymenobacter sp. 102]|uniref:hypothetical protein n=1 Tax=Hymenobacter sp. 102 TaxID=3403152 RepID=UPI003CF58BA8